MTFEMVKEMQADGLEWGEGYRPLGHLALAEIIDGLDGSATRDRRNGFYRRPTYAPIDSQIGSQA